MRNPFSKERFIKRKSDMIEPQEVLLDRLSEKKEKDLDIDTQIIERELSKKKIFIGKVIIGSLLLTLFVSLVKIQIFDYREYQILANNNFKREIYIQPQRGVIYDSSMKQLVFNKETFDIICNKEDLPKGEEERENEIKRIADILQISPADIETKIYQSEEQKVVIWQNVSPEVLAFLKANKKSFPGIELKKRTRRDYVEGEYFSHIIGYMSLITKEDLSEFKNYSPLDYIGRTGLERYYEKELRGDPGVEEIERDALGRELSKEKISDPKNGLSLVLNIDAELQKNLQDNLQEELQDLGLKRAAAVAIDPHNGHILAMVSLPAFDNNIFSDPLKSGEYQKLIEDPNKPFFNRVIAGAYPTGSTIKPLIASAALQEKIISPDREIYCKGYIEVPNPWHPDIVYRFHDWKTHGWTDIRKAIAESCNVFFFTVGGGYEDIQGLGPERIKKYLSLFGWGEKTGIDLPGEISGRIPSPEWKKEHFLSPQDKIWMPGDTYNLSIGQGYIAVTPLQVATAFQAIANGGVIYKPEIVKSFLDENKKLVKEIKPEIIRKDFIDEENLKVVREGMRDAVLYGSSKILNDLPVKCAAKTGTAQTPKKGYYQNWVTVFAPYDNPQIVLTIVIEDVEGMRLASLPVAKKVLGWYFSLDNKK